jgi:uncharacterized protein
MQEEAMAAGESKKLIESYFARISQGDPTLPEMFHDDIVWWVPPGSDMAGTYQGKAAVLEMMGKGMGLYSHTDPMTIHVEELVAEGDTVCAQFVLAAKTAKGRDYRNHYHFVFKLRGEKIVLVKEYVDTRYAHETLFT